MTTQTVPSRIEHGPACDFIALRDEELDIYRGAGLMLARFDQGLLVELFNPAEQVAWSEDLQEMVDATISCVMDWLRGLEGECWLVMCSANQLCRPELVQIDDAQSLARVARRFGDNIIEQEF